MTVIEEFEEEFRRFTKAKYAVAVSSGTAALHIALLACGIGRGDKVITTPFTHISSVNAILYCGAEPIFADINPTTYLIDPDAVYAHFDMNSEAKALLCVHLFGNVCQTNSLKRICQMFDAKLIEDCAQAFGRDVGTTGEFGTFSFYASKNLWTFEGGMLITNNTELAEKAQLLRSHGQDTKYHHVMLGYNYRLPQICALIGLTMLKLHKKAILAELGNYGIKQGHYPAVVYEQPIYKRLRIKGNCPKAEQVAKAARMYFEQQYGTWGTYED